MKKHIGTIIKIIVAIVCFAMVFEGRKYIGYAGLGVQLLGVIGLLTLLFLYNKKFQ